MTKSPYNFLFLCEGDWVLFNLATEEMSLLDAKVKQIYEENDMEGIRRLHPDFYAFLTEKRFAVPDDEDEAAACIARWDREDNDPTTFSLTVNPTLDCNMRCWYCYERHHTDRTMSAEVAASVFKFVERKLAEPELKHFNLSFFGGEPLVEFQSVVRPLVDHACAVADRLSKEVSLSFTTNGYLLTPDVLQYLADTGRHVSFQITLDGNQRLHDRTRHLADGSSSYARILDNCHSLLAQPRTSLTLRCNYTQMNAATFMDLVRDLPDHGITPSEALHIDFQRVCRTAGTTRRSTSKSTAYSWPSSATAIPPRTYGLSINTAAMPSTTTISSSTTTATCSTARRATSPPPPPRANSTPTATFSPTRSRPSAPRPSGATTPAAPAPSIPSAAAFAASKNLSTSA